MIHQVNFLSHVFVTLALLPSLAAAEQPRILCTTSCYHYAGNFNIANWNGQPGDEGIVLKYYQNNKLNFQIWLTEFQRRLLQHEQYKHITINGFHPGYVNSGIWNLANAKTSWIAWFLQYFLQILAYFIAITPQQGSVPLSIDSYIAC
jgi:NAD(P)-dependent dehydrogenase (short-subunit alcohol dehydrogenase family)